MKKLFGEFTKTLNTVESGETVEMGFSRYNLGVCTYLDCNEDGVRDFVIFTNVKKDGSLGKLNHCFVKTTMIWEDCHPYIEWKRG